MWTCASSTAVSRQRSSRPGTGSPTGGGQSWDAVEKVWIGARTGFSETEVADWIRLGARYLGGCCGVGPSGITALRDAIDRSGGTLAAG